MPSAKLLPSSCAKLPSIESLASPPLHTKAAHGDDIRCRSCPRAALCPGSEECHRRAALSVPCHPKKGEGGPTGRAHKWLSTSGIEAILLNPRHHGLEHTLRQLSRKPSDGDVYLYDRKVVPKFRIDMVNWSRKKSKETSVQENHRILKIDKVGRVHCAYTRGRHEDAMMVRRAFWLVGTEENVNSNVLVHYRLEEPLQRRSRQASKSGASEGATRSGRAGTSSAGGKT